MRLLCVTLLCTLWVLTSFAAITSRVHAPRTARPREISMDSLREDNKELQEENKELQEESRSSRQRRSVPGNDSFSHTAALTSDNNPYALVHYSGAHSPLIFVVTQKHSGGVVVQSNIWRTTDLGQHYTNDTGKLPPDAIINDVHISLDKEKLILADQKNNKLYRTMNGGDSYLTTEVDFDPGSLLFHPTIVEVVLAYDEEHGDLYVSSDFGANWNRISMMVHQYEWDHLATKPTVYYETEEGNVTFLWKASIDSANTISNNKFESLGPIETNSLVLYNEFIFVEKQLNQSDTTGEGGLFVSYNRGEFHEAMFPLKTQEQHYLIADATQGQALVAVYHYDNLTNLYTSDASGHSYSLSLQNLRGSDISSWRTGSATVELVRIEGIRGTYIANRLDPVSPDPREWPVFTQITYDRGGTWTFIQRPPYDSEGNPNDNCTISEDCNLNLRIDQPSRSGVYSNENALGIIVAHGNSGKYLNSYWWGQYYSNVYLSRDAGFTWTEEFYRGSYEYSYLDHGGVIVAVSRYSSGSVYTKSITFSCTEGLAWKDMNISVSRLYVIGMLTEPGSTTLEATVFAKTPGGFVEWLIVQLNFSVIVDVTCQDDDYVDWIPSDERQGGHCLLGEMATYQRRKPEVCCFNGRDYERLITTSSCPCKLQDFDCDVGYEKLTTDSPCTLADGTVPPEAPIECPEGQSYNLTLGYRIIPGDKCEGGDYHAYAPRTYLCPIRAPTSLILTSEKDFYRVGETVRIALSQGYGSEMSTVYSWDFGDSHTLQLTGLSNSESVTHSYTAAGVYKIQLSAANTGGVNDVSILVSVLDEIQTASFSSDNILITGLREEFVASYTLLYNSDNIGTISYEWEVGTDSTVTSPSRVFTYKFQSSGNVTIRLKVSNEVSHAAFIKTVLIHSSSDNLRIPQEGQSFAVNSKVSLTLMTTDSVPLPTQGVSYKWDTGEEGAGEQTTSTPALTFQYTTPGDKTIKVHSVSLEDGTTINHVVSGTIHIIPEIGDVISLHHTGTTDESLSVNLTIKDVDSQLYIGPVTLLISDDTNNDWAYNHHVFSVTDGTLMFTLSPLDKYITYKIKLSLFNAVSTASDNLEVSRVKNTDQSVVITLQWVDIPADTELEVWEQQVVDSVTQEIMGNIPIESWRLFVDLSVQQDEGYTIHIRLLPHNNTDEGMQELLYSLNQINTLFVDKHDIVINGATGSPTIPVISSAVYDGTNDVEKVYTLIGLAVGIPILFIIFIILLIPFIICGVIYIRKYKKVSHAYSRLRQTRANNFMFTHDGMDDDDDEPPVSLDGDKGANVKYDLDDNFERTGLDKPADA